MPSSIPRSAELGPVWGAPADLLKNLEFVGPLKIETRSRFGLGFLVLFKSAPSNAALTALSRAAFRAAASSSSASFTRSGVPEAKEESARAEADTMVSSGQTSPRSRGADLVPRDWPRLAVALCIGASFAATTACGHWPPPPAGPGLVVLTAPPGRSRFAWDERKVGSRGSAVVGSGLAARGATMEPMSPEDLVIDHLSKHSFAASRTALTLSAFTASSASAMRRCSGVGRCPAPLGSGSSRERPSSGVSPMTCNTSIDCFRVCQSEDACKQASRQGIKLGRTSSKSAPSTACMA
mmetsp:Transcript_108570/g.317665  ORF Transcript_108570/g.317665 Transcript_108570/m.317665 type:complete len:295 (-) Transcript_108570:296-1180(-)